MPPRSLVSVRMRASTKNGRHISGAEDIVEEDHAPERAAGFIKRALSHPRGRPSSVHITVELLRRKPAELESLMVMTLSTRSMKETRSHAEDLLRSLDISARAIAAAWRVLDSKATMRGAALVRATDGRRLEQDRRRGVRATLTGIHPPTRRGLMQRLRKHGIDTETVAEALTIATKVASAKGVIAELCASDDPDYTTGYIASPALGYVRLPHIKQNGSARGGRVVFLAEDADPAKVIRYLEERPALITSAGPVRGTADISKIV